MIFLWKEETRDRYAATDGRADWVGSQQGAGERGMTVEDNMW